MSKKYNAFSLVEILVALIIISLITAAMAPTITKKLSSSAITIVGGGGGSYNPFGNVSSQEDCDKLGENLLYVETDSENHTGKCVEHETGPTACKDTNGAPSKECCREVGAVYISSESTDGIYTGTPICMTSFNPTDDANFQTNDLNFPKIGVSILPSGSACKSTGNCCWKGETGSANDNCDNVTGYSGCTRTLCQYKAAKSICENWAPANSKVGSWRLPTDSELSQIANVISSETSEKSYIDRYMGSQGLKFCATANTAGDVCDDDGSSSLCKGASTYASSGNDNTLKTSCVPYNIWSLTSNSMEVINGGARIGYLLNSITLPSDHANFAFSYRCVSENVNKTDATYVAPPTRTPDENEPKSQADCSAISPNLLFIEAKYNGVNGKNLCVTKYNAGDIKGPQINYIENSVSMLDSGVLCKSSGNCCWGNGQTASTSDGGSVCTDSTGDYSGCTRTVCQHRAAKTICENWAPNSATYGNWRLPTNSEVASWKEYLLLESSLYSFLNSYQGKNGLQLCCDHNGCNTAGAANDCDDNDTKSYCNGAAVLGSYEGKAYNTSCIPSNLWTNTASTLDIAEEGKICTGYLFDCNYPLPTNPENYALSARCVTDNIKVPSKTEDEYIPNANEPKNQSDCDAIADNLLFVKARYNGANGKNLCVTKFNAGEANGAHLTEEQYQNLGITVVNSQTSCTSGYCCWGNGQTASSSNCTDVVGNYSGCTRTLCQYRAAKAICENWAPNEQSAHKWRLPTMDEATGWMDTLNLESRQSHILSIYTGLNGLQLCSGGALSGANTCDDNSTSGYCKGASVDGTMGTSCVPYNLWVDGVTSLQLLSSKTVLGYLYDGTKVLPSNPQNYAFSTRCVYDGG